jgi:hypothetical protein
LDFEIAECKDKNAYSPVVPAFNNPVVKAVKLWLELFKLD